MNVVLFAEALAVALAAGFVVAVFAWQAVRVGADYLRWRVFG